VQHTVLVLSMPMARMSERNGLRHHCG
jgi:hypothetical protein